MVLEICTNKLILFLNMKVYFELFKEHQEQNESTAYGSRS